LTDLLKLYQATSFEDKQDENFIEISFLSRAN